MSIPPSDDPNTDDENRSTMEDVGLAVEAMWLVLSVSSQLIASYQACAFLAARHFVEKATGRP